MARILAVDDSPVMRQMVKATLLEAGHEVSQAANGEEALRIAATQVFDMVITDLNMPVMDGITLIKNVRQQAAMKTRPILMLTTEGLAAKKEEGKAAGATGWIVKPFDPEKLLATVAKVLP